MQQIERYGVIALVFLLVTIVAVSFWGDSKSPGFWSRITGRGAKPAETASMLPPPSTSDTATQPPLPLNPQGQPSATPSLANDIVAPSTGAQAKDAPSVIVGSPSNGPLTPSGSPSPAATANPIVSAPPPASFKVNIPDPQPTSSEYVVAKGDTGSKIAQKTLGNGKRWSEIAALNPGIDSKSLKIGAHLKLPRVATSVAMPPIAGMSTLDKNALVSKLPARAASAHIDAKQAAETSKRVDPASAKKAGGTKSYTVHSGDTLAAIARRELGDGSRWQEIVALNPGLEGKTLAAGKQIKLPGAHADKPLVALADVGSDRMGAEKPRVR